MRFGEDILLLDAVCFRPHRWFSSHCGLPKRSQKIWFEAGSRSQRRHYKIHLANIFQEPLALTSLIPHFWVPRAEYSLSPKPMTSTESCSRNMRLPIAASLGPKALSLSTDSTIYAALDIVPGRRATSNDVHRWGFLGKTEMKSLRFLNLNRMNICSIAFWLDTSAKDRQGGNGLLNEPSVVTSHMPGLRPANSWAQSRSTWSLSQWEPSSGAVHIAYLEFTWQTSTPLEAARENFTFLKQNTLCTTLALQQLPFFFKQDEEVDHSGSI